MTKIVWEREWLIKCVFYSRFLYRYLLHYIFIDCQNLFGIIYRPANDMKEKLLMFRLISDDIKKDEWLRQLTVGLANTACTADTVSTIFYR